MNVRLYDGTVRCAQHMDASSYQGQTTDPCLHCPAGVSLDKIDGMGTGVEDAPSLTRPNALPLYPLYGHREGLRRNCTVTLASALWLLALAGGTAHLGPTPGTVGPDGKIVPVNF